jgi:erythromycin esterase
MAALCLAGLPCIGAESQSHNRSSQETRMSQSSPERAAFLEWARTSLAPLSSVKSGSPSDELRPLGKMIGNATVVAISEGVHSAAEPLEFRNRVLQYLVQEKGFTAIAIESGIVESRVVHDYVRGGAGELSKVVPQGISWTMDQYPQNHALVRWLRDYNGETPRARKINFYGFDVPGSPGNPKANRGLDTALVETLRYLSRVDAPAANSFRARLDPLVGDVRLDLRRAAGTPGYDRLSQPERDTLTAIIADLVALLERREAPYTAASTASDYEWAYRGAIGARQADAWLREMPAGWRPSQNPERAFLSKSLDVRDRAQADNLDWIIAKEGPGGKILVFAHRYHLSAAPVKTRWFLPAGDADYLQQPAGTYLRRRLADRLVIIGNLIGRGETACAGERDRLEPAPPESLDAIAGELRTPRFLLDLRAAPAGVSSWLAREHRLGQDSARIDLEPSKAFDVLFYLESVTPACPETEVSSVK